MSLPVVLTPLAEADFDAAFAWYEHQQLGLGQRFTDRVRETLRRIGGSPKLHPVVKAGYRKALVKQFPYAIFYREESNRILVISVFHGSRDPAVWQTRINPP